ncbi:putative RNA methyltransferase At5g10620 isoform X2 [Andrographis paniculata]|uniref:putative RNA methyltransferase At5g10620 isoform X2 n=1 Tax=Andrographis paniculata TaxID=175694 RepID=UPI0021E8E76F|nr:putative RNA methyltransferase At5g10620 isoform X2 [Andrographis paniculata]
MDHWSLGQTSPSMGAHLLASSSCRATYVPAPGKQCKHAGQSRLCLQRPLPIRILTVGKKRSAGVQLIVDEYIEKLKHYCPVVDVRVKSNPRNARHPRFVTWTGLLPSLAMDINENTNLDVRAQIDHEDMAVMDLIKSSEWVVMLDERGLDVGSEQIASIIADAGNSGALSITFCIGGPYGHGRQLRERANASIKLSSLVLNHEIALVVLAEQLYRAWTILKGQKYHHN